MTTGLPSTTRIFQVLLVDDSPIEVRFLKDCLRLCDFSMEVSDVASGEECLAFLRKEGKYVQAALPDLIISDFNMPGINGVDLVKALASDPRLQHLPIVVLSSWDRAEDIDELYRVRCNTFIFKPADMDRLEELMKGITHYWFSMATLPTRGSAG